MDKHNLIKEIEESALIWKEISSSEQDLLIKISNYYSLDEGDFDTLINDTALNSVTAKNIIKEENGQIVFTYSVMNAYIQAQSMIKANDLLERSSQEIFKFLSYPIYESHYQSVSDWNSYVCCTFFILINEHQRKDLLTSLSESGRYWQFSEAINLHIPSLKSSLEELASFFVNISEVTKNDLAAGFYYSAVSRFGFFQPQIALELIHFLIEKNDWRSSPVFENLLLGISSVSLGFMEEAIRLAEDWLNSPISSLREIGLLSLLHLLLTDKYKLDKFFRLLVKQMERVEEQVSQSLAYTFVKVGLDYPNYRNECLDQLNQLKRLSSIGKINFGIVSAMAHNRSTSNDFFCQCLSSLSDTSAQDKRTIQKINGILFPFATSDPMIVWKFIEDWILKHNREESVADRSMFLSSIQYAYRANPQLGSNIVTTWFQSDNYYLIEEARKFINELGIQSFSKQVLGKISQEDTVYLMEKLLIGYFDSSHLFQLFFSIVKSTTHFDRLYDYFSQTLFNLALMYPGASKEYFDQSSDNSKSDPVNYLIKRIAPHVLDYQSNLQKARSLIKEELPGSLRRSRKYHEFESKKMQSISRSVLEDDHYSLTSFISKVMIGRGNRSFNMNIFDQDPEKRRTFSTPQGFAEISQTFEMPITELIDPEGELILRLKRLNLHKQDIQVNNE